MKQYLISMYQPDGELPPPEFLAKVMAEIDAIRTELRDAGAWVFGAGLHAPSTATVLRTKDGDVLITDGPFAEGKEHLGGVTIIKAPDLDAALAWARRYALATTPYARFVGKTRPGKDRQPSSSVSSSADRASDGLIRWPTWSSTW